MLGFEIRKSIALLAAMLASVASAAEVREFRLEEGAKTLPSYRTWKFEVEKPGFYAFDIGSDDGKAAPALRAWLNGIQIGYVLGRTDWQAKTKRTAGHLRRFRWLEKGRYAFDLYLNVGAYNWNDDMERAMGEKGIKATLTRLDGGEVGFWMPDDCMARVAGVPLVVCGCAAGGEAREFMMEVCSAGEESPVWSQTLAVGTKPVRFEYPCDREGAFEYVVRDDKGEVVEGPWDFVVTDVGERVTGNGERVTGNVSKYGTGEPVLVDRVDCTEGAGGEHHFREGGKSEIVETPDGAYRICGPGELKREAYRKKDPKTGVWNVPATAEEIAAGAKDVKSFRTHPWFAYSLKVAHPGKSHVLVVRVPNDKRHLAHVVVYDRRTGRSNAWGIDSGDAPAAGPWSEMKIPFWPNSDAVDVMVIGTDGRVNSHIPHPNRRGAVAEMSVIEYPDGFPALEEPAIGWNKTREFGWCGEQIDLGPHERTMPRLSDEAAAAVWKTGPGKSYSHGPALSWGDFLDTWERTFELEAWRGGSVLMYPVFSYSMCMYQGPAQRLAPAGYDRYTHQRTGARPVDPFDRDEFSLMLQRAQKHGVRLVADFMIMRTSSHVLAAWARRFGTEGQTNGMYLVASADGKPYKPHGCVYSGMLNPVHPVARAVQVEFCREFGRRYGRYASFAGIRHRFWKEWPGSFEPWFCSADTGFDDFTVGEFSKASGIAFDPVGTNETAFAARKKLIRGEYVREWNEWRTRVCLSLQEEMLAALREGAPQARFYVNRDPDGYDVGCGLDPESTVLAEGLGFSRDQRNIGGPGVEINHLDPIYFKNFWIHDPIGKGHPLCPPTGLCCNSSYRCAPYNLEPAALALAENRLDHVWAGGSWCLPPLDDALREFVRAYRAIPDRNDWTNFSRKERKERKGNGFEPVAVWWAKDGDDVLFWAVNRTDTDRRVVLCFDKEPSVLMDCVSGDDIFSHKERKEHKVFASFASFAAKNNSAPLREIKLAPFMPGVFRAKGAGSLVGFEVPVEPEEAAQIKKDFAFIASLASNEAVTSAVEVAQGVGEKYFEPAGLIGRRDERWTFADLFAPMAAAHSAKDWHSLRHCVVDFKTTHRFWYEAFGWPEDFCVQRRVGRAPLVGFLRQTKQQEMWLLETNYLFTVDLSQDFPQCKREFVCASQGVPMHIARHGQPGGLVRLELNALFGGGYGDIRVEDMNGETIGMIPAEDFSRKERKEHKVRLETRVLSVPLKRPFHDNKIRLVGTGEKGLAIYEIDFKGLPPRPIDRWQVIGPFDKVGGERDKESYLKAFPPETEPFDANAEYTGMGGETVRWKTVTLGPGERVFDVLAAVPHEISKMNGVAYLRTVIKAKRRQPTMLRYCNDYYGAIWLNGKQIVPAMRGPAQQYEAVEVWLEKGENVILVKTAPGSAGTWHFGAAVNDCGELEIMETK